MAKKTYTSTVASTIESAFSEIEELASECENAEFPGMYG